MQGFEVLRAAHINRRERGWTQIDADENNYEIFAGIRVFSAFIRRMNK